MNKPEHQHSFTLPNGIIIYAESYGDVNGQITKHGWSQIAILAQYPNGDIDDLCYVQHEKKSEKLTIRAFDGTVEYPAFNCSDFQFTEIEDNDTEEEESAHE